MTNLILMAIGIALAVYVWRGLSGVGWDLPALDDLGGGFRLPGTGGMGDTLGCKWSGTC